MAIERITGIVTDIIKHSDRYNVVTLYTRERGRMAMLSSAGNGRTARVRNASLMPLSVISANINIKGNREIQILGQFAREMLWKDIYFNPVKSAICTFITEFLNSYTRNSGPDPLTWDFCLKAISTLDSLKTGAANFHLGFLVEFLRYTGISPDLSEIRPDAWFDMEGGAMTLYPPLHHNRLTPQDAQILPLIARLNTRTARIFKFNGAQRRELLNGLLKYYSIHFPGLNNLKSPEILNEVFI